MQRGLLFEDENIIDSFMGMSESGAKFIFLASLRIMLFQDDQDDYFYIPCRAVEAFKTNSRKTQLLIFLMQNLRMF